MKYISLITVAIVSMSIIGMETQYVPRAFRLGELEKQIVALAIAQQGVAAIRKQVEDSTPVIKITRRQKIGEEWSICLKIETIFKYKNRANDPLTDAIYKKIDDSFQQFCKQSEQQQSRGGAIFSPINVIIDTNTKASMIKGIPTSNVRCISTLYDRPGIEQLLAAAEGRTVSTSSPVQTEDIVISLVVHECDIELSKDSFC